MRAAAFDAVAQPVVNLARNPRQAAGGSDFEQLTRWGAGVTPVAQAWAPDAPSTATRATVGQTLRSPGVDLYWNADVSWPENRKSAYAIPVRSGQVVTLSAWANLSTAGTVALLARFHDGTSYVSNREGRSGFPPGVRVAASWVAPPSAAFVVFRIESQLAAPATGDWLEYTGVQVQYGPLTRYVDGERGRWLGPENASPSVSY